MGALILNVAKVTALQPGRLMLRPFEHLGEAVSGESQQEELPSECYPHARVLSSLTTGRDTSAVGLHIYHARVSMTAAAPDQLEESRLGW